MLKSLPIIICSLISTQSCGDKVIAPPTQFSGDIIGGDKVIAPPTQFSGDIIGCGNISAYRYANNDRIYIIEVTIDALKLAPNRGYQHLSSASSPGIASISLYKFNTAVTEHFCNDYYLPEDAYVTAEWHSSSWEIDVMLPIDYIYSATSAAYLVDITITRAELTLQKEKTITGNSPEENQTSKIELENIEIHQVKVGWVPG